MAQITNNFTLEEMYKSSTATAKKIDNTPTKEVEETITSLVKNVLQPIREAWNAPIVVSSGYRSPKLNRAVGGAANSDHMYGAAADIHTKSDKPEDNKKLFNTIIALKDLGKISCRQIIDEYNYNWIHISINHKHNSHKVNQVLHLK